jgi:hypothetical protein
MEKSKLAPHACDEGHRIIWKEAVVLQIESNYMWRKCKDLAYVTCAHQPVSQSSLETSPVWTPLGSREVSKIQNISS